MRARARAAARRSIEREPFGVLPGRRTVERFTLRNSRGTPVSFIGLGGAITSLHLRDRHGETADVVLGYGTLAEYLRDRVWLGPIIGRYANRIAHGRFALDGVKHRLPLNHGAHHIHGGRGGFDRVLWDVDPFRTTGGVGAVLRHTSPAGTEGYPGALFVQVTYSLMDTDELVLDYQATTSAPTPVNLTQHAYFNLAGEGSGDVLAHEITLYASRFTPVDAELIPTGELRPVAGTPFDFRAPAALGARIHADDEQMRLCGGYDHNLVLDGDGLRPAARLYEPASGRVLEIHTTEPGIQLYTGNALDGTLTGKSGRPYGRHAGVALETQHFPDSPNQPRFPSTILRPGDTYHSRTIYRF
ncbi:MAG TPA: aldose epimerase family protein, partial [Longimicrobium sp.]|nr:aldose epimerase family protein [Longimicrobium sp.]